MKKLRKFVFFLAVISSVLTAGCAFVKENTVLIENAGEPQEISTVPIYKEGNPGAKNMKLVVSLWAELPLKYQQLLVDNGWSICVTDESLKTKLNLHSEAAGVTFPEHKTIYFTNKSSSIEHSFYHEIGHAVDFICGEASQSSEFSKALEMDKHNFMTYCKAARYYTESSYEYFAEAFEFYITNQELLKEHCPYTHDFILQL